ncbi:MAG: hypothetical protein KatS3mg076_1998 [Candidatus Binatia bacterium]|nr:MAG: hypothetical protein KatS3mg076_1998 [Candidatus Binatia bacterium]
MFARARKRRLFFSLCAALVSWLSPPGALGCPGDCDGNGSVSEAELREVVHEIFDPERLGLPCGLPTDAPAGAAEIVAAVSRYFHGCAEPEVLPLPVYRTYPGFPVRLPLGAFDPAGFTLGYEGTELPAGAAILPEDGLFVWEPGENDLGAYEIGFRVFVKAFPSISAAGTIPLKVSPLDACTIPDCDPASGCSSELVPLDTRCCPGLQDAAVRIPEPAAGCPEGRVVFVGRNTFGFGRLQNCDRQRLIAATQSGVTMRFNVEARCFPPGRILVLGLRLETRDRLHTDLERDVVLTDRGDGFAERRGLAFPVANATPDLEGAEANLFVRLRDPSTGDEATQRLRLVLTHNRLPDLPDL